jgi:hypothetical protein
MPTVEFDIETYRDDLDCSEFDCGNSDINSYLKRNVPILHAHAVGRTLVAVDKSEPPRVLGYVHFAISSLGNNAGFPKVKHIAECAAVIIRMLGVTQEAKRNKIALKLFVTAVGEIVRFADIIGINGLIFTSKSDPGTIAFYTEGLGFQPTRPGGLQFCIPISTLRDIVPGSRVVEMAEPT